jgi:hypothetical protein
MKVPRYWGNNAISEHITRHGCVHSLMQSADELSIFVAPRLLGLRNPL